MKKGTSLFSLRNIKVLTNMQKKFFDILVQTALTVGLIWTILELTPTSALLSFTILYSVHNTFSSGYRWVNDEHRFEDQYSFQPILHTILTSKLVFIINPCLSRWKYQTVGRSRRTFQVKMSNRHMLLLDAM